MPVGLIQSQLGPDFFLQKGLCIASKIQIRSKRLQLRTFLDHFGTRPDIVSSIWARIKLKDSMPKNAMPHHLLWALLFLKVYATEQVLCGMVSTPAVDECTFRTWAQFFIKEIVKLSKEEVRKFDLLSILLFVSLSYFLQTE